MKTECYCGGIKNPHFIEDEGCYRKIVRSQTPVKKPNNMWRVNGATITDFTLKQQRGYALHSNGQWSKPKNGGSTNSLPDET